MSYNPFTVNKISRFIYLNKCLLKMRSLDSFLNMLQYDADIKLFLRHEEQTVEKCNVTFAEKTLPCITRTYGYSEQGVIKDSNIIIKIWIDKSPYSNITSYHLRAHVEADGVANGTSNTYDLLPCTVRW
jgi:hypothetical protein